MSSGAAGSSGSAETREPDDDMEASGSAVTHSQPEGTTATDSTIGPTDAATDGADLSTGDAASTGEGTEPVGPLECTREFTMPTFAELQDNPALPDPFTFLDGTPVTTRADWACRRKEISLLAQEFIFGRKPGAPDSTTATFNNGTLSVTVSRGDESAQFSVTVTAPQGGVGPVPGILSLGGITPTGVATIGVRGVLEQLAESTGSSGRQNPPQGDFYRLYPDYESTGSLMAWAWTASRIVDGLEMTTGHNVDTTKLSALGCSRDGKAAATIALFDDRFALVSAQSPGSGTTSAWRVAQDVFTGNGTGNVQTAGQIYGEDTWLGAVFQPFGGQNVTRLPVDQHLVLALAWPRPLIMMEGTNDYWNCPFCSYTTMKYTQLVYQALGTPDDIGFPQPDHQHCGQAGTFAQQYYNSFVDRFLRGNETVSTAGLFTDTNFTFDAERWQDGDVPVLQ